MAYWIAKSDPETYSIFDLQRDGKTIWDGVRNFQARNNLAKMAVGDTVLIYHSNIDKAIVGIAEVSKEAFPDPTAEDVRWLAVELRFISMLENPVSLDTIKNDGTLNNIALVRQQRLSVMQITEDDYNRIIEFSRTKEE
ncbi:MAG: EVE domain-containing protein [Bacteroidota bacterium]